MYNRIERNAKDRAVELRKQGYSLSEIKSMTGISKCTLSVFLREIKLSKQAKEILRRKNYKSQEDAKKEWYEADFWAKGLLGKLSKRDMLIILGMIYWGEGTKSELNIINSDPKMLSVFIKCLRILGINEADLRVGLRLFPNCDIEESKKYWLNLLKIPESQMLKLEFVQGSKKHKHLHGMCRIRLKHGNLYFKQIMSIINQVKIMLP